ncbi:unnamed protein product [Rotaria magnacalcarata]|uniref:Uncharacterized protein n=3 Tax=Rotaria magnacalcarata TaxID=392030 RepID=A0A816V8J4_9BILA|nr:unnamed protein product [Rotaria magnacalcarata]CAF2123881.1 unnamed protein product [Rotaria magnacalcarata]CAF4302715.1 unnamed protein product [Rotaria magnacalcarata]CAF5036868.1 unnamed protein product [Rotaria magnacalcarata]CAF5089652.1 unnamed protein product [Rotaria magnacalcarata]
MMSSKEKKSLQQLDTRKTLLGFSDIVSRLPIRIETKKQIYDIIVKMVKGNLSWDGAVDQLRPLCITLDTSESENTPPVDICQDVQATLNVIIDDLWSLAEEDQFIELRQITDGIRKLFIILFQKLNETQDKVDEYCKKLNDMKEELQSSAISKGHLLLVSLATQILIKIGKFLDRNESPFTGAFRSLSEINNLNNIESFKLFLNQHGYDWPEIRKVIKMLKSNRLTIAHPGDENTSNKDIEDAINKSFPDVSSPFHIKALQALQVLELLAVELQQPLFIPITN